MLKMSDLQAAVAEGIISQDQAERLRDFANRLSGAGGEAMEFTQDTRDEPFRLLRGFRDFFIAIGIVIFAIGVTSLAFGYLGGSMDIESLFQDSSALRLRVALTMFGLVAFGIVLAEWITRHQRLPLASLVTSLAFAFWSALFLATAVAVVWPDLNSREQLMNGVVWWLLFAGGILGMVGFYWRYRLPFALLPLAVSSVGLVYMLIQATLEPGWTDLHARITIGALGFLAFLAAMWFDMKDPLRVTRFAECGFWLHLLAAPMMVHSLLLGQSGDTPNLALTLGTMGVLSLVALLIDRRALLVAGLSYLAIAIGQIVSGSELLVGMEFAITASVLGGAVLCLGLGWAPIRRAVIAIVPFEGLKSRLPPIAAR